MPFHGINIRLNLGDVDYQLFQRWMSYSKIELALALHLSLPLDQADYG